MTLKDKVNYNGQEMSYDEAIKAIRATTLDHEERLSTLERLAEKARKAGWYLLFFFGSGLIQHPENFATLVRFLQELGGGVPPP